MHPHLAGEEQVGGLGWVAAAVEHVAVEQRHKSHPRDEEPRPLWRQPLRIRTAVFAYLERVASRKREAGRVLREARTDKRRIAYQVGILFRKRALLPFGNGAAQNKSFDTAIARWYRPTSEHIHTSKLHIYPQVCSTFTVLSVDEFCLISLGGWVN